MGRSQRPRPARLAEKLLQVRLGLGLTQQQMFEQLDYHQSPLAASHISDFELGRREPPLPLLLCYARAANITEKQPAEVSRKDWVKVHLMTGCKTNIVTAVEASHAHAGDSPYFKPLVETTSDNFPIQSVAADKAYSSGRNLGLVLMKGGMPYIDFRSNATAADKRSSSVWKRMFHFHKYNQEWFTEHYHKRSNVESTFSMIKAKFGERVRSKTEEAQINEALLKVLCHNICVVIQSMYELGIEPDFRMDDKAEKLGLG